MKLDKTLNIKILYLEFCQQNQGFQPFCVFAGTTYVNFGFDKL